MSEGFVKFFLKGFVSRILNPEGTVMNIFNYRGLEPGNLVNWNLITASCFSRVTILRNALSLSDHTAFFF